MTKRLQNAPISAVFLSGNDIGNISKTSIQPKAMPAIMP
jgi:hypothetical protein